MIMIMIMIIIIIAIAISLQQKLTRYSQSFLEELPYNLHPIAEIQILMHWYHTSVLLTF